MSNTNIYPDDWEVKKLEEVAHINMGQSPPGESYNDLGEGKPFLQGKTTFGSIFPTIEKYTSDPKKLAEEGEVLITVRAPVGDVNLADQEYCIGRGLAALSLNDGDNNFLFYYLMKNKNQFEKVSSGSTFKSINKSHLENFEISLPDIDEQKKITGVLTAVQQAIEKTENVIRATKELKKSLMQHLFTYGPVPVEEAEYVELKETIIGMVPGDWKVMTISDLLGEELRNGLYKPVEYIGAGKSLLVQLKDLYSSERVLVPEGLVNIKLNDKEKQKYRLSSRELLINRVSKRKEGVGKVSLIVIPDRMESVIVYESNMFRLVLNTDLILPEYFSFYAQSETYHHQVLDKSKTSNQTSINQGNYKTVLVPVPPKNIQKLIVQQLLAIEQKEFYEIDKKFALEKLFNSLLDNLMTARIIVKDLEIDMK